MTSLKELSPEEGKVLTEELQAVLAKHNAEMGVTSSIQLLKRVEEKESNGDNTTEEVSESPSGESEESDAKE